MTEETAKIFNAPWSVEDNGFCVSDSNRVVLFLSDRPYGDEMDRADIHRITHLPELYEALMEAAEAVCMRCTDERTQGEVQPSADWFMDNPEFCSEKNCKYKHWWYLLRKVRDGEGVSETNQN